jgi:hypothetical protein
VTSLNDNDGELFRFQRLRDEPVWVVPSTLSADWRNSVTAEFHEEAALLSPKHTDILLLRLSVVPDGIRLGATGADAVYARAAFLSWGHLLRRVVCASLDVEPSELEVNIRPVPGGAEGRFEVFLMDSLENGAGYCRHLADPKVIEEYLLAPIRQGNVTINRFRDESHQSACDSACYDCLRDYGNSSVHALLDWRLAIDLWSIASSQKMRTKDIGLNAPHWSGMAEMAANSLAKSIPGGTPRPLSLTWAVESGGKICCVIKHPLWAPDHPNMQQIATEVRDVTSSTVWCNVFDVMRRPGSCLARMES